MTNRLLKLRCAAAIGAAAATVALSGCSDNKGDATACPDFLSMSHRDQVDVIRKAGFAPKLTTADKQVHAAIVGCQNQPPDTTVGDALGP